VTSAQAVVASWSARRLLQTTVTTRGIALGRPVDLVLDARLERALGLDVLCLDGLTRFLPWLACRPLSQAIEVRNPLSLLETGEAEFYRLAGVSLRTFRTPSGLRVEDVDLDADGRAVLVHLRGTL
jgi:hypothetical protein